MTDLTYISWDAESHLIKPGMMAPRLVCISFALRPKGWTHEKPAEGVVLRDRGKELITQWLSDDNVVLVGHNVWYDLGLVAREWPELLPLIFRKIETGLVKDTQLQQQLIDIAEGELKFHFDEDGELQRSSYHLADLSYRLNKRYVRKGSDTWRLRYALLDGVPIEQWPEDATQYAIDDSEITLEVFEKQQDVIETVHWTAKDPATGKKTLANSVEQHKAAWAFHLMSMWGVRTDSHAVSTLKATLEKEYARYMAKLRPSGLYKITPARLSKRGKLKGQVIPEKVSKDMKALYARVKERYEARGKTPPLTEKGKISTARKTLKEAAVRLKGENRITWRQSGLPLKLVADAGFTGKLLTTYVPVLEQGVWWPINPRFNTLVETGRGSCSKPNMQNPPRKGGVRECFIPRKGWVFVFCDYETLELRSLAQVCLDILGKSTMAEALRRGIDLHLALAAELADVSYEEAGRRLAAGDPVIKELRQQAKVANFGFPGGLGVDSFIEYAEGMGLIISAEKAARLKKKWEDTWTEMRDYFAFIDALTNRSDQLTQVRSNRVRGGASFCAAANGFFQGLAADGAKEALWRVARECYLEDPYGYGPTALYGTRPVLFLHDEIGIEVPYADPVKASEAADRLQEVMIEAMQKWIPDIPITCKPVMCKRWFKGAEATRINGLLVPSKPVKVQEKTKWIADLPEALTPPSLVTLLQLQQSSAA